MQPSCAGFLVETFPDIKKELSEACWRVFFQNLVLAGSPESTLKHVALAALVQCEHEMMKVLSSTILVGAPEGQSSNIQVLTVDACFNPSWDASPDVNGARSTCRYEE